MRIAKEILPFYFLKPLEKSKSLPVSQKDEYAKKLSSYAPGFSDGKEEIYGKSHDTVDFYGSHVAKA